MESEAEYKDVFTRYELAREKNDADGLLACARDFATIDTAEAQFRALYASGKAHELTGNFEEALAQFRAALDLGKTQRQQRRRCSRAWSTCQRPPCDG